MAIGHFVNGRREDMDPAYMGLFEVVGFGIFVVAVVAIVLRMIHETRQDIRRLKETKPCPTCEGSGRVKKEEQNNSGSI